MAIISQLRPSVRNDTILRLEEFRSLAKFEIPIQLDRQGEVSSPSRLCSDNLAATAQKGARSGSHNSDRYHYRRALGNQKSTGEQNTITTDVL
jgi:hypothetical protein